MDRVIGDFSTAIGGPTVLCVGGIHGSEPAGTYAAERVIRRLERNPDQFRGRLVAIRGNLQALEAGCRYLDRDLNRMWNVDAFPVAPPPDARENVEMRALETLIERVREESGSRFPFLDLHTTSGRTIPFFWLIPSVGARTAIRDYAIPAVYDPANATPGTLAHYMAREGHPVLLAEGGKHDDPAAVDHLEAVIWIWLVQAGCLPPGTPEYAHSRAVLAQATGGENGLFRIVGKHHVLEEDEFRMRPGYESFQAVGRGEHLADDQNGSILAPLAGRILMPLYKPPCDDGFLIVEATHEWPGEAPAVRTTP